MKNKLYEAAKNLSDIEIFKWLKEQKFQTEQGDQEYTMMYEIDMPKIFKKFIADFFTAYEQEQPEAIAGENEYKLSPEITLKREFNVNHVLNLYCGYRHITKDGDYVLPAQYDKVITAMEHFASQQTAHKDQKITDLSGELHATDKLNQELQDEIAELKQRISELEKLI